MKLNYYEVKTEMETLAIEQPSLEEAKITAWHYLDKPTDNVISVEPISKETAQAIWAANCL